MDDTVANHEKKHTPEDKTCRIENKERCDGTEQNELEQVDKSTQTPEVDIQDLNELTADMDYGKSKAVVGSNPDTEIAENSGCTSDDGKLIPTDGNERKQMDEAQEDSVYTDNKADNFNDTPNLISSDKCDTSNMINTHPNPVDQCNWNDDETHHTKDRYMGDISTNEMSTVQTAQSARYEMKIKERDDEIDELRTRLSQMMKERVTDSNPDVTDLSDPNRPMKLAERFSELYNNEWGDAFDSLENGDISDRVIIDLLLRILKEIFRECRDKASSELEDIRDTVTKFTGCGQDTDNAKGVVKHLKEERKKNFSQFLPSITQKAHIQVAELINGCKGQVNVRNYVELTTELCWLMSIQDPPCVIETTFCQGKEFNEELYKTFTESGCINDYLVWPALYLCDGGQLLSKGIAQPMKTEELENHQLTSAEETVEVTSPSATTKTTKKKKVAVCTRLRDSVVVTGDTGSSGGTGKDKLDTKKRKNTNPGAGSPSTRK